MNCARRLAGSSVLLVSMMALTIEEATAQYTPYFFDGFDVSADSSDINFEIGTARQGGAPAPISYVTTTADSSNDFRHQLFSAETSPGQPLQLAEDGTNLPGGEPIFSYKAMVSPDFNFNGTLPNGDIIGKRITFELDVAAFLGAGEGQPTFTQAGITLGGERTLIDNEDEIAVQNGDPATTYFSTTFQENLFGNLGAHAGVADSGFPITDNTGCIGCNLTHTAGFGVLNVQIDIDDPNDGNPWDGVGSTAIEVFVNGDPLRNPNNGDPYFFEKTGGGYTDNFITLYGQRQTFVSLDALATHTLDNFTVWSAPLFPAAGVPGDYNGNGIVDAADYAVWLANLGADTLENRDPDAVGPVGLDDYTFWKDRIGNIAGAGSGNGAVPEPASVVLLGMACLGVLFIRSHTY